MKYIQDAVRECDIFAIPITLTYKGDKEFTSIQGGIISIICSLTLVILGVTRLHDQYVNPVYDEDSNTKIFSYYTNQDSYQLNTSNFTLAIAIVDSDADDGS